MKISKLPRELRILAENYREKSSGRLDKKSDDIDRAFHWCETEEGDEFWYELFMADKLPEKYQKYTNKKLYKIWN